MMIRSRTRIFAALFLALAVRLCLMPITLHGDLIFIHYFPHFFSYHGVLDIYGYFGDHFIKMVGTTYYQPLVYYAIGIFQWFLRPINPEFLSFMNLVHERAYSGTSYELSGYLAFFSRHQIFWMIFLMKLPYLAAEIACWAIAPRLFSSQEEKGRVLKLFLWSPVIIFSSYVLGQYRIFSVLAMLLSIFALQRGNKAFSGIMYAMVCLMENYAVLLLPFMALVIRGPLRERLRWWIGAALCLAAVLVPLFILSKGYVLGAYFSPRLLRAASARTIFNHFAGPVNLACKAIWGLSYAVIFIFLLKSVRRQDKPVVERELFIFVPLMLLMILYATSITSVHYLMWSLPFLIIVQIWREPWKPVLTWVFVALAFLFNLDGRAMNLALFLPLDPHVFSSAPSLHEVLAQFLPWGKIIAMARLSFSLVCLYFAWKLWQVEVRPRLER